MLVMKLKESLGWKEFPNIFVSFFVLYCVFKFFNNRKFLLCFFVLLGNGFLRKDFKINSNFQKRKLRDSSAEFLTCDSQGMSIHFLRKKE